MLVDSRAHRLADGTKVVVRSGHPDDGPALYRQVRAVLAEDRYFVTTLAEHQASAADYAAYARSCAESPRHLLLVAAVGSRVVGMLDFSVDGLARASHSGTFEMSIARRWRRRGVGRLLVEELLGACAALPQIERVCLSVLSSNSPARSLYASLGFAEEGRRVGAVKLSADRYCDEVWMYRPAHEVSHVR